MNIYLCMCVWSEEQVNHHYHQRVLFVYNLFIFRVEFFPMMLISHDLPTEMFDTHLKTTKKNNNKKSPKIFKNVKKKIQTGRGCARAPARGFMTSFFFFFWVCLVFRWRKGTPKRLEYIQKKRKRTFWLTGLFPLDLPKVNPLDFLSKTDKRWCFRLVASFRCYLNDGRATIRRKRDRVRDREKPKKK